MKSITPVRNGRNAASRAPSCAGLRGEFSLGLFSELQGVTSPEEGRNTWLDRGVNLGRERLSTRRNGPAHGSATAKRARRLSPGASLDTAKGSPALSEQREHRDEQKHHGPSRMNLPILLLSSFALMAFGPVETGCKPPKAHTRFEGVAVDLHDGDTIYVRTATCRRLSVRLIDFRAPELSEPGGQFAKRALSGLALNRQVSCKVTKGLYGGYQSYGRAHAICSVDGVSLGASLKRVGVPEGGRGFRPSE